MAAFPTLSVNPSYPYSVKPEDTGLASAKEYGYVQSRKRFTKNRSTHNIKLEQMTNSDRVLLQAHINSVGKHTSFTWTDPLGSPHTVRFVEVPALMMEFYDRWNTEFELLEI